MPIKNIPLSAKQREQLLGLGFNEEEINNETLIDITLWKQALSGNVSAINSIRAILQEQEVEQTEDPVIDLTEEVKREEEKILDSLEGLSETQKRVNAELVHNVAFMSVELKHLSLDIAKNGVKEKYKNGANQWGYKDRTEVKTYNNLIKSYQACMKQLNDLLNQNGFGSEYDEFDEFNK